MHCLFCKNNDSEVIETRLAEDGRAIRRRRVCPTCKKRFTTYERVEELPILVIKRDGRRERFSRDKLRNGVLKAAEKTTVSAEQVQQIVSAVESEITQQGILEVESTIIGHVIAQHLKQLDKVAYIRFSSVFRRFVDVEEFEKELKKLL
ncbi:MAG: hypothetical protein RI947_1580 [Candidatus Parcubacteria bacterium]|jgi:transcriptional repressor NrdR